jgi:hypothetical protein
VTTEASSQEEAETLADEYAHIEEGFSLSVQK